ncbi:stage III sporulation protein AF [Cohnella lubricantis]
MAELAAWLGRIVAVVLLVSLVDLILPNQTMQRYVRLVAGLLVLLTVATPVLSWFRSDFSEKLSANIGAVQLSYGRDEEALAQIETEGQRLSEAWNEQAARLATARLSAEIRAAVEEAGFGAVRSVDVQTEPDGSGVPRVSRVELTMSEAEAGMNAGISESEEDSAPIADVEPVAPVDIRIDEMAGSDADAGAGAGARTDAGAGDGGSEKPDNVPAAASEGAKAEDAELSGRVAALLQTRFGVAPERVIVWKAASDSAN